MYHRWDEYINSQIVNMQYLLKFSLPPYKTKKTELHGYDVQKTLTLDYEVPSPFIQGFKVFRVANMTI